MPAKPQQVFRPLTRGRVLKLAVGLDRLEAGIRPLTRGRVLKPCILTLNIPIFIRPLTRGRVLKHRNG